MVFPYTLITETEGGPAQTDFVALKVPHPLAVVTFAVA